jgi:uncharacterized protein YggT (Ycf19 family)
MGRFVHFIYWLTEPLLKPFRNLIPPLQVGAGAYLDLSPLIFMLVLGLLRRYILFF